MIKTILSVLIGIAVGAALGLYLGWVTWPAEFSDASPATLNPVEQREYALMTAVVYADTHDLQTARRRITSLGKEGETGESVYFSITLDSILRDDNEAEIRSLVQLAAKLGLASPAMEPFLAEGSPDE